MRACLEDVYHAIPRWRPRIVIRLIPIVAFFMMGLVWLLCIIAIGRQMSVFKAVVNNQFLPNSIIKGCFDTGWATGGGYDVGWQKDSGGGNLGPSLNHAGQAAIAGNVIGIFAASIAILAIFVRGLGIGYRGTTCFAGLMCFFCLYVQSIFPPLYWIAQLGDG